MREDVQKVVIGAVAFLSVVGVAAAFGAVGLLDKIIYATIFVALSWLVGDLLKALWTDYKGGRLGWSTWWQRWTNR